MGKFRLISWGFLALTGCLSLLLSAPSKAEVVNQPTAGAVAPPAAASGSPESSVDVQLRGPVDTPSPRFFPQPVKGKSKKQKAAGPPTFNYKKARKDGQVAKNMAQYMWLDKAAAANPEIIESITWHHDAALKLAKHIRLGDVAEGDRYLCRRLTRWKDVAFALAENSQADRVIARDPEGMYRAIARWPGIVKVLAKNPLFNQMVIDVPDLADVMAQHM